VEETGINSVAPSTMPRMTMTNHSGSDKGSGN
jgi:hypothetical protein